MFDPTNYAQNVMTAANTLQQINNQITSLQNEAQMLINQGKNLANLPYSSLQSLQQSIGETQRLLNEAQRIAYDVRQIDQAFSTQYGAGEHVSASSASLIDGARQRWQNSLAALQDAMRVQAGIVQSIDTARSEAGTLLSSSQSAVGALQASQAGNQLLALQSKQLADVTALLASQGRAQSLELARQAEAQEQAREQMRRFIAPARAISPAMSPCSIERRAAMKIEQWLSPENFGLIAVGIVIGAVSLIGVEAACDADVAARLRASKSLELIAPSKRFADRQRNAALRDASH